MTEIRCPYCGSTKSKLIKKWKYDENAVKRLECECSKKFNFYKGKKSTWTIPKASS